MGRIDLQVDVQRKGKASILRPVESSQLPNGHNESPAAPTQNEAGGSNQANPGSLNQEHLVMCMDPEIYWAVTTGNTNCFIIASEDREGHTLMDQVTPQGNTVLHLAAISGYDHLVELILGRCPNLLWAVNSMGNLAHHAAANAGHLSTLKYLVHFSPLNLELLAVGNKDGDNPMHMAMRNGHKEVAMFLVESNPKLACHLNKEHKSPLYMAAEAGCLELVKVMIERQRGEIVTKDPVVRSRIKSVVHAAIARKKH